MRKLRDRRGITLTEMLCTVLIVLLLTALLVVGIRFAGKTYTESMRLSEAQELCSTLTSVISDKLRFCGTVTQDENGGLTQIFIQNVGSVEGKGDACVLPSSPFRSVKTASWRWAIVTCWAPPPTPRVCR